MLATNKEYGICVLTWSIWLHPGGLTDMTIMSESFGAKTHIVALLHLIRLTTVLTVLPMVIKILTTSLGKYSLN